VRNWAVFIHQFLQKRRKLTVLFRAPCLARPATRCFLCVVLFPPVVYVYTRVTNATMNLFVDFRITEKTHRICINLMNKSQSTPWRRLWSLLRSVIQSGRQTAYMCTPAIIFWAYTHTPGHLIFGVLVKFYGIMRPLTEALTKRATVQLLLLSSPPRLILKLLEYRPTFKFIYTVIVFELVLCTLSLEAIFRINKKLLGLYIN